MRNVKRWMMILVVAALLVMAPVMALAEGDAATPPEPQTVEQQTTFTEVTVTVQVRSSAGAALDGVSLSFRPKDGYWGYAPTTDANGDSTLKLAPGSYEFKASYNATSETRSVIILGDEEQQTVTFSTAEACIAVKDTAGAPLNGAVVYYSSDSGLGFIGTTGADGIVTKELFAGEYQMYGTYRDTVSATVPVRVESSPTGSPDHTFVATLVTFNFPGTIAFQGSYYTAFTKPSMAMFPGAYDFTFTLNGKSITRKIEIGSAPYTGNLAFVRLTSSTGEGLAGGQVSYYAGGWVTPGVETDQNGFALLALPAGKNATSVSLTYKGGIQQIDQSMTTNPYYAFQTQRVTVKLLSSEGDELAGEASYYAGGWRSFGETGQANNDMEMLPLSYTFAVTYKGAQVKLAQDVSANPEVVFKTVSVRLNLLDSKGNELAGGTASFHANGWRNFGDNGEGNANASMEMLPTAYSFAVSYNGSRQQMDQVNVGETNPVVFQTGAIKLYYAGGAVQYYTNTWLTYREAIELLPGNVLFTFSPKNGFPKQELNISPVAGALYEKTVAYVRLVNSAGAGIEGGSVKYYDGGWKELGRTDNRGVYFALLDGNKAKSLSFGMTLGGGYVQKSQDLAANSHILFATQSVEVKLVSSTGAPLGGEAKYYAGGWNTFGNGNTNTAMELLPAKYSFGVTYLGGYMQKEQDVSQDKVVVFTTVPVSFNLKSSKGENLDGEAKYYAGGWKTFGEGNTNSTMELLPVKYSFGVTYLGGYLQKEQDVNQNQVVEFKTVPVTFKLLSSSGRALDGTARFYAGSWRNFGTGVTNKTAELLPVSYTFEVGYLGATLQKTQNVATDPVVVFKTKMVSLGLVANVNLTKLITLKLPVMGENFSFYANGWKDLGKGAVLTELLPTSYTFACSFRGENLQLTQNIDKNPFVVFTATRALTAAEYLAVIA